MNTCFPCCGRFLGNYIVILYLIVKFIYILNTVLQVYFISGLLGKDFWVFGFSFISALMTGQGWAMANSRYFPSKFIELNFVLGCVIKNWIFLLLKRSHFVISWYVRSATPLNPIDTLYNACCQSICSINR